MMERGEKAFHMICYGGGNIIAQACMASSRTVPPVFIHDVTADWKGWMNLFSDSV